MASEQGRGCSRPAGLRRGWRNTSLRREVRTYGEIRDAAVDFRGRSERLVADAVRQRKFREHVPIVARIPDETPVAEICRSVAKLDFCICGIAQKEIREIISDARSGGSRRLAIGGRIDRSARGSQLAGHQSRK